MRSNISIIFAGLAGLASALPVSNLLSLASRDAVSESAAIFEQRDVQIFEEIDVYVDGQGNTVSSSTRYSTSTASQPAPTGNQPAPTTATPAAVTANPAPTPANTLVASGSALGTAALAGTSFTRGITYTQYRADKSCRTAAEVNSDITTLVNQGYDLIRIYGSDCSGPQNLFSAIKGKPVWMFLGIYDPSQAAAEAQDIATQLGNDWSQVHTISVGNEVVNAALGQSDDAQQALVGSIVSGIGAAKDVLRAQGYQGPVVNVDTMVAVQKYPELCTASDYCAMNCHAFFDGSRTASEAGAFVDMFVGIIKTATGKDKVVITETGWPTCGANGVAVGSPEQQGIAIASLKGVTSADMIYFSGYNELWKDDTTGTEHCWGQAGNGNGS